MARRNSTKARALSPKIRGEIEECIIKLAREEGLQTDDGAKHRTADRLGRFSALPDYNVRVAACAEVLDEMTADGRLEVSDGKYRPAKQKTPASPGRSKAESRPPVLRPNPGARVAPAPPVFG